MFTYYVEFSKTKEGRFLSHLELLKTWERVFRRSNLPLAFSEGFNPHPKISYASALAVGVTSDAEYMEFILKEELSTEELRAILEKNLPPALKIKACTQVKEKRPALMARIRVASYLITLSTCSRVETAHLEKLVAEFLKQDEIIVQKRRKKDKKYIDKDIRAGIYEFQLAESNDDKIRFKLLIQTGSEGNIRPEEVLSAFQKFSGLPLEIDIANIHRTGLFVNENDLKSPIE